MVITCTYFIYSRSAKDISVCPFNKLHVVPSIGLQRHIIKCMKNYPNHKVCPYNALHRFLDQDHFVKHILECRNKSITWALNLQKFDHGDLEPKSSIPDNIRSFNLEHENWDE